MKFQVADHNAILPQREREREREGEGERERDGHINASKGQLLQTLQLFTVYSSVQVTEG